MMPIPGISWDDNLLYAPFWTLFPHLLRLSSTLERAIGGKVNLMFMWRL
jgi:hypothetical protein